MWCALSWRSTLTATLLLDGQPPAELLAQTEVTVDGELDCRHAQRRWHHHPTLTGQSAADGLRRITVQASGTDDGEPYQITAEHKLELASTGGYASPSCADRPAAADAVPPAVHGDEGVPRKIRVSKTNFTVGATACRFGPHGFSGGNRRRTPLHHIPQVYGQSSGQVRHGAGAGGGGQPLDPSAERKAKVTAVSAVSSAPLVSIKSGHAGV